MPIKILPDWDEGCNSMSKLCFQGLALLEALNYKLNFRQSLYLERISLFLMACVHIAILPFFNLGDLSPLADELNVLIFSSSQSCMLFWQYIWVSHCFCLWRLSSPSGLLYNDHYPDNVALLIDLFFHWMCNFLREFKERFLNSDLP